MKNMASISATINTQYKVITVSKPLVGFGTSATARAVLDEGHAVVAEGAREQMELHARAMHDYGLWATVRRAPQ